MDQEKNEKLFQFISEIRKSGADSMVLVGDIVESELEDDYYQAIKFFGRLPVEKVFVQGNRGFYNGSHVCFSSSIYDLESALDLPEGPLNRDETATSH